MFIFLFDVVSWAADCDFTDDRLQNSYEAFQVRVKRQKIIYNNSQLLSKHLTCDVYCLSSNKSPDYRNKTSNCKHIGREAIAYNMLQDPSSKQCGTTSVYILINLYLLYLVFSFAATESVSITFLSTSLLFIIIFFFHKLSPWESPMEVLELCVDLVKLSHSERSEMPCVEVGTNLRSFWKKKSIHFPRKKALSKTVLS